MTIAAFCFTLRSMPRRVRDRREIRGWPGSEFGLLPTPLAELAGPAGSGVPFAWFSLPWGSWTVKGQLAMTHGNQVVISEVAVSPAEGVPPGGISRSALNLPLSRIRADVWGSISEYAADWLRTHASRIESQDALPSSESATKPRGRKPYSDDELEKVARLYLEIQRTGTPRIAADMANRLGESVSSVNNKIRRATDRGFLGSAAPGRGGGRSEGPRLVQAGN